VIHVPQLAFGVLAEPVSHQQADRASIEGDDPCVTRGCLRRGEGDPLVPVTVRAGVVSAELHKLAPYHDAAVF
jgi:hypothetical protein